MHQSPEWLAELAVAAIKALGVDDKISVISEGGEALVFDTGYDQVAKLRRNDKVKRPTHERIPGAVEEVPLSGEYTLSVVPKLTEEGVQQKHQDALVIDMWRDGVDFYERLPAASNPKKIKNVALIPSGEFAGSPYMIDEGAVNEDRSETLFGASYERGADGRRTIEAFRRQQKDEWEPMSDERIDAALSVSRWPERLSDVMPDTLQNGGKEVDREALEDISKRAARAASLAKRGGEITV